MRRSRPELHVHSGHPFVLLTLAVMLVALAFVVVTERPLEEAPVAAPSGDDVPDPAPAGGVRSRLLVKFADGTPAPVVRTTLDRAGVTQDGLIAKLGVRIVRVAQGRLRATAAALASSPAVEYAERDVRLTALDTVPNDAYWADQWGPQRVSAPRAWDVTRGSESVVIAVLDTGAQLDHPDLAGAFVAGYDFVNDDPDPADDHGHGTATAGVIAARTNNRRGVAGACWTCSIMPLKVLASDANGDASTVARGIVWAADRGARVINLSLGGPDTTQTLTDAIAYATARGALVVAGAGNEGTSAPFYPAASAGVIGVAAIDDAGERYEWSNYGPWVRVAAPGCNLAPLAGGEYGDFCGTSSAAPLVAGIVGLAFSLQRGATSVEIELALEGAAEPNGAETGHGRVDAAGMLTNLGAPSVAAVTPRPVVDTPFQTRRGRVSARGPARMHAFVVERGTLVATVTFARSSRLTLSVLDPSGRPIRRVSGRAPLRATAAVRAGTYRLVVSQRGARAARYTLRVANLERMTGS